MKRQALWVDCSVTFGDCVGKRMMVSNDKIDTLSAAFLGCFKGCYASITGDQQFYSERQKVFKTREVDAVGFGGANWNVKTDIGSQLDEGGHE